MPRKKRKLAMSNTTPGVFVTTASVQHFALQATWVKTFRSWTIKQKCPLFVTQLMFCLLCRVRFVVIVLIPTSQSSVSYSVIFHLSRIASIISYPKSTCRSWDIGTTLKGGKSDKSVDKEVIWDKSFNDEHKIPRTDGSERWKLIW